MSNEVLIAIVVGGGTFLGAVAGGLTGFGVTWLREKHESKRRSKELIIKAAIEEWARQFDVVKQTGAGIMPLDNYIAHYALVLKSVLDENFDIAKFRKALEQSDEIIDAYYQHSNEERPGTKKSSQNSSE